MAPKQDRSQQTYEALLACAERLLTKKPFHDISLTELCDGASCTTGAFYHRFANKKALLLHLEDRLYESAQELVDEVFLEANELTGRELLCTLITGVVDFYVKRQGSIRALTLAGQSDSELQQRLSRRGHKVMQRGSEYLGTRFDIRYRDPGRSIEFALFSLRAVLREAILFGSEFFGDFSRQMLITELVEQLTRYLGLSEDEL